VRHQSTEARLASYCLCGRVPHKPPGRLPIQNASQADRDMQPAGFSAHDTWWPPIVQTPDGAAATQRPKNCWTSFILRSSSCTACWAN